MHQDYEDYFIRYTSWDGTTNDVFYLMILSVIHSIYFSTAYLVKYFSLDWRSKNIYCVFFFQSHYHSATFGELDWNSLRRGSRSFKLLTYGTENNLIQKPFRHTFIQLKKENWIQILSFHIIFLYFIYKCQNKI